MADELKYKVSIETDQVEADDLISPSAIQALVELNREIDDYRKQLNDLKQAEKEQGELSDDQATRQQILKNQLKETSTEYNRQQRELIKVDTASKALGDSYNDLVKQNAAISAAMRAMPIGETSDDLRKLQAQYNANNERLKEFDKSMGNHQRNVGNYGSALDNLGGILSSIPGPIGNIVRTFEQFSKVLQASGVSMATKTTTIQGFTVAESAATTATVAGTVATAAATTATVADTTATVANAGATSANATAQTAQATATTASATAIGFDTSATVANTVATTANTGATSANATAQGAQAVGSTASAAAIGRATVAQRLLNTVMKANPILLVVGLIASLIAAFSKFQPVIDFATKSFQLLTNTILFFVDKVGGFLGIIEATDKSLGEVLRKTNELANAEVKLRDAKREQLVATAEADKIISELRLKAADMTLSEQERLKALEDIEEIERYTMNEKMKLAEEDLRIAKERAQLNHSDAATLDDIAQKKAAIFKIEEESNNLLVRITTRRTGLEKKAEEDRKRAHEESIKRHEEETRKIAEEQKKRDDIAFKAFATRRQQILSLRDELQAVEQAANEQIMGDLDLDTTSRDDAMLSSAFALGEELAAQTVDQAIRLGDQLGALELRQAEELRQRKLLYLSLNYTDQEASQMALTDMTVRHAQERADAELAIQEALSEQQIQNIQNLGNTITGIGTAMFGKSKAIAVAQAIIDTFAAANSALKNTPGGVLAKSLAAAAVVAKGLANVRMITSTKIGSGGGGSAGAAVSNVGATVSQAETPMFRGIQAQGMNAMSMAANASPPQQDGRPISVFATVDRRGLALAVRDGERSIRTQQYDFK